MKKSHRSRPTAAKSSLPQHAPETKVPRMNVRYVDAVKAEQREDAFRVQGTAGGVSSRFFSDTIEFHDFESHPTSGSFGNCANVSAFPRWTISRRRTNWTPLRGPLRTATLRDTLGRASRAGHHNRWRQQRRAGTPQTADEVGGRRGSARWVGRWVWWVVGVLGWNGRRTLHCNFLKGQSVETCCEVSITPTSPTPTLAPDRLQKRAAQSCVPQPIARTPSEWLRRVPPPCRWKTGPEHRTREQAPCELQTPNHSRASRRQRAARRRSGGLEPQLKGSSQRSLTQATSVSMRPRLERRGKVQDFEKSPVIHPTSMRPDPIHGRNRRGKFVRSTSLSSRFQNIFDKTIREKDSILLDSFDQRQYPIYQPEFLAFQQDAKRSNEWNSKAHSLLSRVVIVENCGEFGSPSEFNTLGLTCTNLGSEHSVSRRPCHGNGFQPTATQNLCLGSTRLGPPLTLIAEFKPNCLWNPDANAATPEQIKPSNPGECYQGGCVDHEIHLAFNEGQLCMSNGQDFF